jgi:hypothetical protein
MDDGFGADTYLTHIRAVNVTTAQARAQGEVQRADGDVALQDEYEILLCCEGFIDDIKRTEWS